MRFTQRFASEGKRAELSDVMTGCAGTWSIMMKMGEKRCPRATTCRALPHTECKIQVPTCLEDVVDGFFLTARGC